MNDMNTPGEIPIPPPYTGPVPPEHKLDEHKLGDATDETQAGGEDADVLEPTKEKPTAGGEAQTREDSASEAETDTVNDSLASEEPTPTSAESPEKDTVSPDNPAGNGDDTPNAHSDEKVGGEANTINEPVETNGETKTADNGAPNPLEDASAQPGGANNHKGPADTVSSPVDSEPAGPMTGGAELHPALAAMAQGQPAPIHEGNDLETPPGPDGRRPVTTLDGEQNFRGEAPGPVREGEEPERRSARLTLIIVGVLLLFGMLGWLFLGGDSDKDDSGQPGDDNNTSGQETTITTIMTVDGPVLVGPDGQPVDINGNKLGPGQQPVGPDGQPVGNTIPTLAPGESDPGNLWVPPTVAPAPGDDGGSYTVPTVAPAPRDNGGSYTVPTVAPAPGDDGGTRTVPTVAPAPGDDGGTRTVPTVAPAPGDNIGGRTVPTVVPHNG